MSGTPGPLLSFRTVRVAAFGAADCGGRRIYQRPKKLNIAAAARGDADGVE